MTITTEKLHGMTYSEIERFIFKGAEAYTPVSINERLGNRNVMSLIDHPCWTDFPRHFKSWIWIAIDGYYLSGNNA